MLDLFCTQHYRTHYTALLSIWRKSCVQIFSCHCAVMSHHNCVFQLHCCIKAACMWAYGQALLHGWDWTFLNSCKRYLSLRGNGHIIRYAWSQNQCWWVPHSMSALNLIHTRIETWIEMCFQPHDGFGVCTQPPTRIQTRSMLQLFFTQVLILSAIDDE